MSTPNPHLNLHSKSVNNYSASHLSANASEDNNAAAVSSFDSAVGANNANNSGNERMTCFEKANKILKARIANLGNEYSAQLHEEQKPHKLKIAELQAFLKSQVEKSKTQMTEQAKREEERLQAVQASLESQIAKLKAQMVDQTKREEERLQTVLHDAKRDIESAVTNATAKADQAANEKMLNLRREYATSVQAVRTAIEKEFEAKLIAANKAIEVLRKNSEEQMQILKKEIVVANTHLIESISANKSETRKLNDAQMEIERLRKELDLSKSNAASALNLQSFMLHQYQSYMAGSVNMVGSMNSASLPPPPPYVGPINGGNNIASVVSSSSANNINL